MSGIAGIFRRDGAVADRRDVHAMVDTINHRGPDRNGCWVSGSVGLGHTMLWTTPESLNEVLPLSDPSSELAITSDARIDNREELISELNLNGRCSEIADSRLILYAYEKWGNTCAEKLVGDFVFAIWNKRRNELFCARDPMGIKCLYYFASPALFAFASEIKALCCLPGVPKRLNEARVLDYLVHIVDDRSATFYKDIYRLPSATVLTVSRATERFDLYWSLDANKELKLSSDDEYTEAFRECFLKSVKSRMRSAYPVGTALSGGLDSSSIACVARKYNEETGSPTPIHTFSLIFPSLPGNALRQIDERKYMDDVLNLGGFKPSFVRADERSPLHSVRRVQEHLDEAFFAGNLYLHWAMYENASEQGTRIFLDGLDGDTTVSHGLERLTDLTMRGKWKTLFTEATLLATQVKSTPRQIIKEYSIKPFCPIWAYNAWRRLHGRPGNVGALPRTFVSQKFSQRLALDARIEGLVRKNRKRFATAREKHREMLMFPLYAHALEMADKATAAFRIEARYPFFDKRLIELCLSLPGEQKLSRGWGRAILRKAMGGILPESIRWRQSKGNLSSNFYLRLLDQDRPLLNEFLLGDSTELEPYVDLGSIRDAYRLYEANPLRCHDESFNIFTSVNLAIWLRTSGIRP